MPFSKWNWLTEPVIVLLYFPLLIALGAGALLTPGLKKVCVFSGKISYPLYMTHYAVLWMFGNYYTSHKPGRLQLTLIIIAGLVLLVGAAYLIMIIYDMPVRKYLTDKRKVRLARQTTAGT
jgi:peptidoglycan/LPS O-acetylase OafA/YrhL